ncbi:MAG: hypothetical protein SNJ67_04555 [Chloracidobacterium sp.]|uniref:Uncharacterized protein n=1 Tax=Chloracidobacterium validum TaxID=2821543 RepID=A0ABX8B829_9BACT|nr:hypothetical protein [Chloracidobacterium validum]QUW03097.1 hypothetical protein J8C06_01235 [Chloracidobacterium validum]
MSKRYTIVLLAGLALLGIGGGAFAAGVLAGRELSAREAQRGIQQALGGRYARNSIHIRRVLPGFSSSDAIVEAQVEATFKFTRTAQGWQATEVRLADRDWRKLDVLTRTLVENQPGEP